MRLNARVNGAELTAEVASDARLIDVLRDAWGLKGTKEGCAEGECGACTAVIDGVAVNACLVLAVQVQGRSLLTVEGLVSDAVDAVFQGRPLPAPRRAFRCEGACPGQGNGCG